MKNISLTKIDSKASLFQIEKNFTLKKLTHYTELVLVVLFKKLKSSLTKVSRIMTLFQIDLIHYNSTENFLNKIVLRFKKLYYFNINKSLYK